MEYDQEQEFRGKYFRAYLLYIVLHDEFIRL